MPTRNDLIRRNLKEEDNMSKHTEGKWLACNNGECQCGIIHSKEKDFPIATVLSTKDERYTLGCGLKEDSEEYKANARLIATAPELLEALEKSQNHLEYQVKLSCNCSLEDGKCNTCEQIERNEKVLKKVKGEIE